MTPDALVLIVEDDEDIRTDLADLLALSGYRTATAANGQEALGYLTSFPLPHLIVLDLMMPAMNGWELRTEMRKIHGLPEIPIVVISGGAGIQAAAAAIGAVAYVT